MAKTHCKHGHQFTEENTRYTKQGWQVCVTCKRLADRKMAASYTPERRQELQAYTRQWRLDNLDQSRNNSKRTYNRVREVIEKAKDVPCTDCGEKYPHYVMDFDHRDRATKKINVGATRSMKETLAEIEKCDIVCSNCHRIRTWKDVTRWVEETE